MHDYGSYCVTFNLLHTKKNKSEVITINLPYVARVFNEKRFSSSFFKENQIKGTPMPSHCYRVWGVHGSELIRGLTKEVDFILNFQA